MTRIIAGSAGGVRLASVPGDSTRPTTDRTKEALFSQLEAYGVLQGAYVLDLFGGSGALGCESLSRGAVHADFCDIYPKAVHTIERNLATVGKNILATGAVYKKSARTFLTRYSGQPWNLVFLDPPYEFPSLNLQEIFTLLTPHLATDAVVVVERSSRTAEPTLPTGLEKFAEKKYGETVLYYLEPTNQIRDRC